LAIKNDSRSETEGFVELAVLTYMKVWETKWQYALKKKYWFKSLKTGKYLDECQYLVIIGNHASNSPNSLIFMS